MTRFNLNRRKALQVLGLSAVAGLVGNTGLSTTVAAPPETATGRTPDVELELTAAPGDVSLLPGAPTRAWRFSGRLIRGPADTLQTIAGSYLGPVIRLRRGQRVRIRLQHRTGRTLHRSLAWTRHAGGGRRASPPRGGTWAALCL